MLSTEFNKIFENFPSIKSHFSGCFSADNIPKEIKETHFVICNTDVSTGPGIHWYVLFRATSVKLEAFDSLSFDESKREFLREKCKLKRIREIEYNKTQFQPDKSINCGMFVLYFIFMRLYNIDMTFKDLLNEIFVDDQSVNEQKVEQFHKRILSGHGFK